MNVSVVLPAKNEEQTLPACLSRLEPQLYPDDEVLVLDNGSDDRTAAAAASFDGVRVIDAPDDAVPPTNHYRGNLDGIRQMGAELARNEIIISTDADTLPPPDWIGRIREHFETDSDLDLVWGVPVDTNGVPLRNLESKFANLFGAISGCNTAFRRSTFEKMEQGYVGWPFYEDMAFVTRIARMGKAIHDRDLEMPTDMDRRRFQTLPIMAGATGGTVLGAIIGGPPGAALMGSSVGMAGTELIYEEAPKTRFHHDQVGLGLVLIGITLGGAPGFAAAGVGSGLLGHHLLTEGSSAIPSGLMENTNVVCTIPDDGGMKEMACEPPDAKTVTLTRILAAMTAGGLAARVVGLAQQRVNA